MRVSKALVFSLLLLLTANVIKSQNEWDLALAQYRSGDYDAAIRLWDSIGVQEPSAAVFYNLGNAWYEKGDIPHAVLYYEKALLLDPGYRNARKNLEQVRQQIDDPVPVIRRFFLLRWWNGFVNILSPNIWALIFLLSFSSVVALWVLGMYGRINWGIRKYLLAIFFLLTILAGFAGRSSYYGITADNRAVIVVNEVNLYTSPDEMSPVLREFPGGTVVRIIDQLDSWLLVVLPNMEQGWVQESTLKWIKK